MNRVVAVKLRTAFVVVGIFGLGACVTTPDVSTKLMDGVRLEQYKTYTLLSGQIYNSESGGAGDPTGVGRDLETDVRTELDRRGLKSSDKNPDLAFSYAAAKRLEHAGERAWPYYEGAIDLVAKDSAGRIIWSSHLQAILDPSDKTHRHLKEAVGRAFKNYPFINQPGS